MQNTGILNKLEKKFGKYAIKNLIVYILIGYAIGYALFFISLRTNIYQYITLSPALVMQGQVWRLFTWVLTVPQTLSFFVVFVFVFYYFIGKSLENSIGAFKYNLFMFSGWFFITLGCMAVYWITSAVYGAGYGISFDASTYYLNLASFLAFAIVNPNAQVYLFFVLPIKMLWLAVIDVIYIIIEIIQYIIAIVKINFIDFTGTGITASDYRVALYAQIFSIVISLLNVLIFFLLYRKSTNTTFKDRINQTKRKSAFEKSKQAGQQAAFQRQQEEQINKWQENLNRHQNKSDNTEFDKDPNMAGWAQWYNPNISEEERNRIQQEYEEKIAAEAQAKQDLKDAEANRRAEERENRIINKRKEVTSKYGVQSYQHKCEICGRTNVTNPDLVFRFCSKCDGNHEYCEDHIFTHEHKHE